jgi:anti-sigma regulatory factor (Ser/Thr protein kinase)
MSSSSPKAAARKPEGSCEAAVVAREHVARLSMPLPCRLTRQAAGSCVRVTTSGSPEAEVIVVDERFDASTLHLLRERIAACTAAVGMPKDLSVDVLLAVHELAANVVTHGAGAGRLLMRGAVGMLRCEVTDDGPRSGPWPLRKGHGLWLVRAVADEVTASSGPHGSQVTVRFGWRAPPGPRSANAQAT